MLPIKYLAADDFGLRRTCPRYLCSADYFIKSAEREKTINHVWARIKRDENRDANVRVIVVPLLSKRLAKENRSCRRIQLIGLR